MKVAKSGNPTVIDKMAYSAGIKGKGLGKGTSKFGAGTTAGKGWFCVYNGNGTSVTVNSLTAGKGYRVVVIEYNGATKQQLYLVKGISKNSVNFVMKNK